MAKNMASGAVTVEYENNIVIYNAIELDDVILGIRRDQVGDKVYYRFPVTKKENGKTRETGESHAPKKFAQYEEQLIAMIEAAK